MKRLLRIASVIGCFYFIPHLTQAQMVDRDYLTKEYDSKGGASSLSVEAWRKDKLQSVLKDIRELPEHDKKGFTDIADKMLKQDWKMFKASDYLTFKNTGGRAEYEALYFGRRWQLNRLVIGELMERKGKYIPEIVNGIWLLCEESSWAIPACMFMQKMGDGLPDPDDPIVELFTGDTATLLAWIKFLLRDELDTFSPVVVKRIDYELNRRVTDVYLARNDFEWEGFNRPAHPMNNWNIWINTNMLLTAALALDSQDLRTKVIEKAIHSADRFIDTYKDDGGCDEGPSYWRGAGGRLIQFVTLLSALSDNKLRWNDKQLIHNMIAFIYKAQIADDWYMDYSDSPARLIPEGSKVFMGGKLFDDEVLKQFGGYLYREAGADKLIPGGDDINTFVDNVELDKELRAVTPKAPLPQESWLPDLQEVTLRQQAGRTQGLFLGAHAGTNGKSHNHNDVGSFMLYTDGQPVLIDPGTGHYTKETFGPNRYHIWIYSSDWHNCPTINGYAQHVGGQYAAKDVSYTSKGGSSVFTMDLAHAYPDSAGINSWKRTFTFDRDRGVISLTEQYDLKEWKEPFYLNFVSAAPATLVGKGVALLKGGNFGGALYMKFDPDLFELVPEGRPIDDPSLAPVWGKMIYRIRLRSRGTALKGEYSVQFTDGTGPVPQEGK